MTKSGETSLSTNSANNFRKVKATEGNPRTEVRGFASSVAKLQRAFTENPVFLVALGFASATIPALKGGAFGSIEVNNSTKTQGLYISGIKASQKKGWF